MNVKTKVKETPIIFSTPMIPKVLDGTKTQTRRTYGLEKINSSPQDWVFLEYAYTKDGYRYIFDNHQTNKTIFLKCPYGQAGDRLWVREAFYVAYPYSYGTLPSGEPIQVEGIPHTLAHYAADGEPPNTPNRHYPNGLRGGSFAAPDPYAIWGKKPSIHMPRWANRTDLENIIDPIPQRLHEITEEDAIAEGWPEPVAGSVSIRRAVPVIWFSDLWDSLKAKRGYGWENNNWVWKISFNKL